MFIQTLGSSYINQIKWRGMWAFVTQRLENRNIVYGESFQHSPEYNQWGKPVTLRTSVRLLTENVVICNWIDSEGNRRRKEFCDKYEGYDNVCNCEYYLAKRHYGAPRSVFNDMAFMFLINPIIISIYIFFKASFCPLRSR